MIHGGDIYTDGVLKGKELLDFSSNINPIGVPKAFKDNIGEALEAATRYPDIKYRELRSCLKTYINKTYDCDGIDEELFILGNGAAEIIDLSISMFKSILIVVPSFLEYELDAVKWNCRIEYSMLNESMEYDYEDIMNQLPKVEAVIIGNPNNPNGGIINKKRFLPILEACEKLNKTIIIDEAFIEFTGREEHSFVNEIREYKSLFIIRALTKFFAMPGIRFGYGITGNMELLNKIKDKQNPWNINCFAETAAKHVLFDEEYIKASHTWISEEKSFMLEKLKTLACMERVHDSHVNYILCKLKALNCSEFYNECLKRGILVRKANNFKGLDDSYVRLAVKDRERNLILLNTIIAL